MPSPVVSVFATIRALAPPLVAFSPSGSYTKRTTVTRQLPAGGWSRSLFPSQAGVVVVESA